MEEETSVRHHSGRWIVLGLLTGLATVVAVLFRYFEERGGAMAGAAGGHVGEGTWASVGKHAAENPLLAPMAAAPSAPAPVDFAPSPGADSQSEAGQSVPGDGTALCPLAFPVKVSRSGIAYEPHQPNYSTTVPHQCFVSMDAAIAAGYRRRKS